MSQTDRQTNGGQTEPCQQMAGVCDSDSFAPSHGYVTHTSDTRSTGDARHFLPRSSSASWLRRAAIGIPALMKGWIGRVTCRPDYLELCGLYPRILPTRRGPVKRKTDTVGYFPISQNHCSVYVLQ